MPSDATPASPDAYSGDVPLASPTIAERLRSALATVNAPFGWSSGVSAPSVADVRAMADALYNHVPMPDSVRDHLTDVEDLATNTANAALSKNPVDEMKAQAGSIANGLQQGATGFNEGLSSTVLRPLDAIPYFVDKAMGGEGVHPLEGTFNKYFVDPAGPPTTPGQQKMRAGGDAVGQNVPLIASGLGLATSGARYGVSLAQQAAGGLVDSIEAPAAASAVSAPVADAASAPAANAGEAATSGVGAMLRKYLPMTTWVVDNDPVINGVVKPLGRAIGNVLPNSITSMPANIAEAVSPAGIQSGVQNVVNALNPTNVVNAFNPANLQGAADSTLDFVAQNPRLAVQGKAAQAFHSGVNKQRLLQAQQAQQPPAGIPPDTTATPVAVPSPWSPLNSPGNGY